MHRSGAALQWDPFPPARHDDSADRHGAYRAVGISALGLGLTGLVELAFAALSGSVGLLGDALHNLSDVSTSGAVWIGLRVSRKPASPSHTYGYDRSEDLAGLVVALIIGASAVFAAVVSFHKLLEHGTTTHLPYAMGAAGAGIVGNQVVARYKLRVGRRIQSATLVADAQHSWLDSISSFGALLGLVATRLGARWADPVAGFVVTLFVVRVGWEVTRSIVGRLMDAVDPAIAERALAALRDVPGLHHGHVRARWTGRTLLVEVDGFVDSGTSIDAAEALGTRVEQVIVAALPEARAVIWSPHLWTAPEPHR